MTKRPIRSRSPAADLERAGNAKARVLRAGHAARRGASVVEGAIVLPLVIILLVGMVDLAIAVYASNTTAEAARVGTRYAIAHGAKSKTPLGPAANNATVENKVRSSAPGMVASNVTVTSTWLDGNNNPGSRVKVTVNYNYRFAVAWIFGASTRSLRGESTMTIPNWKYQTTKYTEDD